MKRRILGFVLVLVLALSFSLAPAAPAQAAATLSVPSKYATIQSAIDAAKAGDKIIVQPGTYSGATVTKAVELIGNNAVINSGPQLNSYLMVGFYFPDNYSGSGATIRGFTFQGTVQENYIDDGKLDFPIFSRGANGVTVEHNTMVNSLQAITNWHGSGWTISHNKIEGLWTLNGGGIGILVGDWNKKGASANTYPTTSSAVPCMYLL